jgi:hypothetical protein
MERAAEVITALGGLSGLSAVIASIATLIQAKRIREQVSPNHGSSLADAVNRTDAKTAETADSIARLEGTLTAHGDAITRIEGALVASSESVRRIEAEQVKSAADVIIARHSVESLAREFKGIGHEIGDLRSTRDREHADYDARLRKLEAS